MITLPCIYVPWCRLSELFGTNCAPNLGPFYRRTARTKDTRGQNNIKAYATIIRFGSRGSGQKVWQMKKKVRNAYMCLLFGNSTITRERRQRKLRARRTFAFCLRSFWVSLWGTWVSFFHFLKFVMNFLKGVVSIESLSVTSQKINLWNSGIWRHFRIGRP